MKSHRYALRTRWTGNLGSGTSEYKAYSRDHEIAVEGKPVLAGSSDPAFRGDSSRYNPEELLVASLSACHMLWYLHLCADAGIVVTSYEDGATGAMTDKFTEVVLSPEVTISDLSRIDEATRLHHEAHELCFIARSVNFPVVVRPHVQAPA